MWRTPTPITLVLLVLHRSLSRLLGPVHLPILLLCEQGVTRDLKHQDCCIDSLRVLCGPIWSAL